MVKKINFLPVVAATITLGAVAFAEPNQANAYVMQVEDGFSQFQVCHTMNDILVPVSSGNATYTYTITGYDTMYDFSTATVVSGGSIKSADVGELVVEMPFEADATSTTATNCIVLDLSTSFIQNGFSDWGISDYSLNVSESSSDETHYPSDDDQEVGVAYYLNVDASGNPIQNGNDYESYVDLKSMPTFESSQVVEKTHIEVSKKVKGKLAKVTDSFNFKVNLTKKANAPALSASYVVKIDNTTKTCTPDTDCTFSLKHGQTATIGLSGSTETLIENGYDYTIQEVLSSGSGYTASYAMIESGIEGSTTAGTTISGLLDGEKNVVFYNENDATIVGRFLSIFPFVVLAISAALVLLVVRQTSKKKQS